MGKAGRWIRNLFLPGRKGRKAKDRADADCQSVLSAPLCSQAATTPSGREKRRWSFRRPGASKVDAGAAGGQGPLASMSSHCFSEAEVHVVVVQEQEQDQQQQQVAGAVVVVVPEAAADTVFVPLWLPAPERSAAGGRGGPRDGEAAAALKIQSAFRSYLARKALCALRGMVKLQAMVRGQLVRRQASLTLRRMQALVDAQWRARAERLRLLVLDDDARQQQQQQAAAATTPRPPPSRRSPQHPRSRKPLEAVERGSEENVRIVEVDDGAPRAGGRRSSASCNYSASMTPSRTPAKPDPYQKVSPTPSALTDASARTLSGRFDDASFASASASASEATPTPTRTPVPGRWRKAWRAADAAPFFPSYMANTESSRAKARSQSAPRQRLSSASETAAASPSPSCCERPSPSGGGSGARRRASLDPLDLRGAPAPSRRMGMERCASRAMVSGATSSSLPGSECGSSSTLGHRDSALGPWHG